MCIPMETVASLMECSKSAMPDPSCGIPVHGDLSGMRIVYLWVGSVLPGLMVGIKCAAVIPLAGSNSEWQRQVERVRGNSVLCVMCV